MLRIKGELDRREFLVAAASIAVATALPTLPTPAVAAPVVLWPQETRLQRQALIVHVIREHIAERENRHAATVTTDDIHDRVHYFGLSRDQVVAAEVMADELNQRFPRPSAPRRAATSPGSSRARPSS